MNEKVKNIDSMRVEGLISYVIVGRWQRYCFHVKSMSFVTLLEIRFLLTWLVIVCRSLSTLSVMPVR